MHLAGSSPETQLNFVSVTLEQGGQFVVADPRQHGRVCDLVAVQVEDGQDCAVASRVQELVRMPTCGERAGLGLPVAHDAADEQVGVVERRPESVGERVP